MRKAIFAPLLALAALLVLPARLHAQFTGYVGVQGVTQTLYSSTACTGTEKVTPLITNVGQSQHALFITTNNQPMELQAWFEGSTDGTNFFRFSDEIDGAPNNQGVLNASGYYALLRAVIVCSTGTTFTASYSGTGVTPTNPQGNALTTQIEKKLLHGAPAGTGAGSQAVLPPFGTSLGEMRFQWIGGSGPAGSTLTVVCGFLGINTAVNLTYAIPSTAVNLNQTFSVPSVPCESVTVSYVQGGASSATFNLEYDFFPNGSMAAPLGEQTAVINTASAGPTQIIPASGGSVVRIVSINLSSGTAEGIDLQQGTGSNCATGNSQLTGVSHLAANTPWIQSFLGGGLEALAGNAVCIHLSGANQTDGTITYSQY